MGFKFLNKAGACIMAAAMLMSGTAVMNTGTAFAEGIKYEFEDAKISGDITVENNADASGGKALKMENTGTIELKFNVEKDGVYNLVIYSGGIGGAKQQNLSIDGVLQGALGIPESTGFEAVKVSSVKLNKGEHTLLIEKSWGYSNFDYMTVEDASSTPIVATQTTPVDADATAETKNLMSYLASVYGEHIISGQQEIYKYGPHSLEMEFEYLENLTGHMPAIRGFDYGNFTCPAFGSDDGSTDRVIDWVKNKNGIATASWHLNVPIDMSSYTTGSRIDWGQTTYNEKTDFSPSKAIVEGTKENLYYMEALKTLAEEFKKLEAEGIPIIWRPLHEAEGGGGETGSWFWWGREGSKVYKDLWHFTYKTLTEDFGCHNLIWEWNSYNFATSADWYPGDEYVDIIGYDKYSCADWSTGTKKAYHNDSAISATFYGIMEKYNNAKMVAMAENDSFSTVENLTSERAGWLYFLTWYDGNGSAESDSPKFLSDPIFNTEEDTIAMYQSDYCITLDELPADLYSSEAKPIQTTTTVSGDKSTTTTTTTNTTVSGDDSTTTTTVTTKPNDDDFKFELKKYKIDKKDGFGKTLKIEIKGAPKASIGGAFGYSNGPAPEDWVNIEWKGNADDKGSLVIEIDTSEVPENIIEGELQIWWSNVWNAETKDSTDKDCELVAYDDVILSGGENGDKVYGDANEDGELNVADAVLIMQSLSNPNEYKLSENAMALADVIGNDGVTAKDALVIQMIGINLISASDLPISEDINL